MVHNSQLSKLVEITFGFLTNILTRKPQYRKTLNLLGLMRLALLKFTLGSSKVCWCLWFSQAVWGGTLSTTLTPETKSFSIKYCTMFLPMKPHPETTRFHTKRERPKQRGIMNYTRDILSGSATSYWNISCVTDTYFQNVYTYSLIKQRKRRVYKYLLI